MIDLEKCIAEIEFRFPCVRDHEFTSKEWQTLKASVLSQQANNIPVTKLLDKMENYIDMLTEVVETKYRPVLDDMYAVVQQLRNR